MAEKDVQEMAEALIARGTELLREKHYTASVEAFEAVLRLVPGHDAAERYLRFASVGAKGARRAKGETTSNSSESTIPAGDFKILKRSRRPRAKTRPRNWTEDNTDDEG